MLSHRPMEPGSGLIATRLLRSRVMKVTTWWEETLSVVSNPRGLGIGMECSHCAAVSQFLFKGPQTGHFLLEISRHDQRV